MHPARPKDGLSVSLVDFELHEEVELLTRLMLAANEAEGPVAPRDIDELLLPSQRF